MKKQRERKLEENKQVKAPQPEITTPAGERPRSWSWRIWHILLLILFFTVAIFFDAFKIEPHWLVTRTVNLHGDRWSHRIVHISDLHYRGDIEYTLRIVDAINRLNPDFVCFTGDIVDDEKNLKEALELLSFIRVPLYGVPGNHEKWVRDKLRPGIDRTFALSGGAWLEDEQVLSPDGSVVISGAKENTNMTFPQWENKKRLLLVHFPEYVTRYDAGAFDLILAGHSHGGQVCLPFYGPPIVPYSVGKYKKGFYDTPAGPLYVNPGLGTFHRDVRFLCRPEITVILF